MSQESSIMDSTHMYPEIWLAWVLQSSVTISTQQVVYNSYSSVSFY